MWQAHPEPESSLAAVEALEPVASVPAAGPESSATEPSLPLVEGIVSPVSSAELVAEVSSPPSVPVQSSSQPGGAGRTITNSDI